jgi:hypothetical protein
METEAALYNKASFSGLQGYNLLSSFDTKKKKKVYDFISMNFGKGSGS